VKGALTKMLRRLLPTQYAGRIRDDSTIARIHASAEDTRAFIRAYEERVALDRRLACPMDARPTREDVDRWSSSTNTERYQ
jgi:hypothetical protein